MKKRNTISKIMTENLKTVNHTNTVEEVDVIIKDHGINHFPVVSGDKLIDMISKTDIEQISFIYDFNGDSANTEIFPGLKIEQIMTKNVKSVQANDTIQEAAKILSENEFHALPVLENERIVGIVTTTDMMKYLVEEF